MATSATTGQPVQVNSGSQVADWATLVKTLLGQQGTTTQTGDTAALQALIAQLQGTDYNAVLQSIFQQASGQIPGLQAAYGNAIGARSGSNSAVQAGLNDLLKQTTVAGAKQVADMQLANQQIQANAGANIAQANRTTTESTPGMAKELMGLVGLTQAAMKLTNSKDIEELGKKFGFGGGSKDAAPAQTTAPAQGPVASAPVMQPQAQVTSAQAPQMSLAPWAAGGATGLLNGGGASSGLNVDWTGGMSMAPDMGRTTMADILGTPTPQMSMAPSQPLNLMQYFDSAPAADMGGGMGFGADDWEQYF